MEINQVDTKRVWKEAYAAALLELHPVKLNELLNIADKAIQARLHELESTGRRKPREMLELDDAKRVLMLLRNHNDKEASISALQNSRVEISNSLRKRIRSYLSCGSLSDGRTRRLVGKLLEDQMP